MITHLKYKLPSLGEQNKERDIKLITFLDLANFHPQKNILINLDMEIHQDIL